MHNKARIRTRREKGETKFVIGYSLAKEYGRERTCRMQYTVNKRLVLRGACGYSEVHWPSGPVLNQIDSSTAAIIVLSDIPTDDDFVAWMVSRLGQQALMNTISPSAAASFV